MPYWSNENSIDISHEQPREFEPNYAWHEGMGDAVMNAPVNVGSRLLQSAYLMGGGLLNYSAGLFDGETAEFLEREGDAAFQVVDKLQKHLDDNYRESAGWAAGLVQNVGEIVGGVAATGAVGYGSTYAATEAAREVAEGKDVGTALALGTVRGGAITIGALATAAIGTTIGQKVLSGAGINVGVGIAQRGTEKAILSGEYQNEADQLMVLDPIAILADTIMGGAFGVFARQNADAAEAVSKLKKVDDEAPVKLKTAEDVAVHRDNMREVVRAELEGEQPVLKENVAPKAETAINKADIDGGRAVETLDNKSEAGDYTVEEVDLTSIADFGVKQNEANKPELQTYENLDTVGGGKPEQSWIENTRINGEDAAPATIYRGSKDGTTSLDDFSDTRIGGATSHPSAGLGVWFSSSREDAAIYGTVGEYHLDIRNPKIYSIEDFPGFDSIQESKALRDSLISQGHDGIVIDASDVGGPVQFVSFKPESVINKRAATNDIFAKQAEASQELPPPIDGVEVVEFDADPNIVMADGRTYAQSKAESDALIVREKRIAEQVTSALNCLLTGA